MIIFLVTFIDKVNEQNFINQNVENELNLTKEKIDGIIKLNEEQKEIIKKYIKKDNQRKQLEKEISIYKEITKTQSKNLKENISTIQELEDKINLHKKL
jgi:dGTP triphosphohydrolase